MMNKMKVIQDPRLKDKAVLYLRYSSESQTENSIEGQRRECMEFAKKNGMAVLSEYIDRAMTGTNDNRPEFRRMIRDSSKKGLRERHRVEERPLLQRHARCSQIRA